MGQDMPPQLVARPLTPGDVSAVYGYGLPATTEVSGGLSTVGKGQAIYLEAEVDSTIAPSSITNVVWSYTSSPVGLPAVLTSSALGTNVPVYEPADRLVYQVAGGALGRKLFRGSMEGRYTVTASIMSTNGTTNVTKTFTIGSYLGIYFCKLCHSGGQSAPNKYDPWKTTGHSMIFTEGIDGLLGYYAESCIKCHTVGYDTDTNAVNGGFDDVAKQYGWVFPTPTNGNWANMVINYPLLTNVANIQCENCHGSGSQHAYSLGNTNLISVTVNSGDCNQCHDAPPHHIYGTEWYNSMHAITTREPSGPSRAACVGCHTSYGFIGRIEGDSKWF